MACLEKEQASRYRRTEFSYWCQSHTVSTCADHIFKLQLISHPEYIGQRRLAIVGFSYIESRVNSQPACGK
jgi:hypothetical protein